MNDEKKDGRKHLTITTKDFAKLLRVSERDFLIMISTDNKYKGFQLPRPLKQYKTRLYSYQDVMDFFKLNKIDFKRY